MKPFVTLALGIATGFAAHALWAHEQARHQCSYLADGYKRFDGTLPGSRYTAPSASIVQNIHQCWAATPYPDIEHGLQLRGEKARGSQRYVIFDIDGVSDASLLFEIAGDTVKNAYFAPSFTVS